MVHVDAPRVAPPLGPMSSLDEWLEDPEGHALLREALKTDEQGRFVGTLGDPEMRTVVGNFPLQALAGMDVIEIDRDVLAGLVARPAVTGGSAPVNGLVHQPEADRC